MLWIVAVFVVLYVLVVLALTYLAKRWLHVGLAILIWLAGATYLTYLIIDSLWYCSRPPVWVPPAPDTTGEGTYMYNCDSAGGVVSYAIIMFFGPLGVAALLITGWFWAKHYFVLRET